MVHRTPRPRRTETRAALIDAARAVIERDGLAAATTRRIAEEAALPLGTVHYWFGDKNELLSAVTASFLEDIRSEAVTGPEDESIATRLTRIHDTYTAMPEGRQLALFEITTQALRADELRGIASEQYAAYTAAAHHAIAPWAADAEKHLEGGIDALTALSIAVIDGLTLAGLATPGNPAHHAALTLFGDLVSQRLAPRNESESPSAN